jgi:hypothetical protein
MPEQQSKPKAKKVFRKNYYIPGLGHATRGEVPTTEQEKALKAAGIDIAKLVQ